MSGTTSGTLPNGTSYVYPGWSLPPGYVGWVIFTATIYMDTGDCTVTDSIWVGCDGVPAGKSNGNRAQNINLRLAPNPAQHSTMITYQFATLGENDESRTVEVYDLTGRRLAIHHAGKEETGNWNLSLDNFTAGIYQVVLRQQGKVVATTRLSVTR